MSGRARARRCAVSGTSARPRSGPRPRGGPRSRVWRPDLVLWGAKAFAGAVAAAASGAAHARVLYSVDVYTRLREDFRHAAAAQPPGRRADTLRGWPAGWAARYGVEFSEDLVGGQFTIAPLPPSFRPDVRPGTPGVQFVPYNGPAVVPGWPAGPVRLLSAERIQEILDSVAGLDIELVPALPPESRRALRAVPAHTRVVESVPLSEVLATCAAVVHHGGTWSFGCALRHGVPQLLIGRAFDAPLKFGCLERAGGAGHEPGPGAGSRGACRARASARGRRRARERPAAAGGDAGDAHAQRAGAHPAGRGRRPPRAGGGGPAPAAGAPPGPPPAGGGGP
ncbi:nucleotide disphospho-sugar-binding domain-containing protein, partial [Streptomyces sp. NPDC058534]|uniref:nucleotide disphospho-sugar-binding domain-containing protein n=1 Tax=Streptomyces sp. NPDC058534 TaxID=3346541 RepID=UPI00366841E3